MTETNRGVFRSEVLKEVSIEHEDETYQFKLRELSWSEMNKVLSRCTSYTTDRKGIFDLDMYYREALIQMMVESPWGPFSHTLVTKFTPEFGAKLETLVPMPGGTDLVPFGLEQS